MYKAKSFKWTKDEQNETWVGVYKKVHYKSKWFNTFIKIQGTTQVMDYQRDLTSIHYVNGKQCHLYNALPNNSAMSGVKYVVKFPII